MLNIRINIILIIIFIKKNKANCKNMNNNIYRKTCDMSWIYIIKYKILLHALAFKLKFYHLVFTHYTRTANSKHLVNNYSTPFEERKRRHQLYPIDCKYIWENRPTFIRTLNLKHFFIKSKLKNFISRLIITVYAHFTRVG